MTLEGGRTKFAQIFPEGLCTAICRGFIQQIKMVQKGQFLLAHLAGTNKEVNDVNQQLKEEYPTVENDNATEMEQAWDDVTGVELDPSTVRTARGEEVAYIRKMDLYTKVPVSECWGTIGEKPIQVRWIDVNKGGAGQPNYRSRLVAK